MTNSINCIISDIDLYPDTDWEFPDPYQINKGYFKSNPILYQENNTEILQTTNNNITKELYKNKKNIKKKVITREDKDTEWKQRLLLQRLQQEQNFNNFKWIKQKQFGFSD